MASVLNCSVRSRGSISFRCIFPIALNFSPRRWRQQFSANRQYLSIKLHGVTYTNKGIGNSFFYAKQRRGNDNSLTSITTAINRRSCGNELWGFNCENWQYVRLMVNADKPFRRRCDVQQGYRSNIKVSAMFVASYFPFVQLSRQVSVASYLFTWRHCQ